MTPGGYIVRYVRFLLTPREDAAGPRANAVANKPFIAALSLSPTDLPRLKKNMRRFFVDNPTSNKIPHNP